MKTKLIMSPNMARYLIKNGNKVVDIKPKKEDVLQTLFVFEVTEKLLLDMDEFKK